MAAWVSLNLAGLSDRFHEEVNSERRSARLLSPKTTLETDTPISAHRSQAPSTVRTELTAIFMSLELSQSKWLITSLAPGTGEKRSTFTVAAKDVAGLLARFAEVQRKAEARTGGRYVRKQVSTASGCIGSWKRKGVKVMLSIPHRLRFGAGHGAPRPSALMVRCSCEPCLPTCAVTQGCARWLKCRPARRRLSPCLAPAQARLQKSSLESIPVPLVNLEGSVRSRGGDRRAWRGARPHRSRIERTR